MNPETFHRVKDHYEELEGFLRDKCIELPFHLDGPEYDQYCYMMLHPFKEALQAMMLAAAEEENFERALAIQRFIQDRLGNY